MIVRKRVVVSGDVQGVGFRFSAVAAATRLGVSGYVRNRSDGGVEAEVEGGSDAVERMLEWLRQGPSGSRVTRVTIEDAPPAGESGFDIRR
jgi:acylphosphatase